MRADKPCAQYQGDSLSLYVKGVTVKWASEKDNKMGQYKARKATFTVEGKGKNRVFRAVNSRAHTVARKAGKRSVMTYAQLKASKGKGTYKFYAYNSEGVLKPVRF